MCQARELVVILSVMTAVALAGELTFELPDNEKQCFHEIIDKGVKCTLEFQVGLSTGLSFPLCKIQ